MDNDEKSPAKGLAEIEAVVQSKQNPDYRKRASALEVVVKGLRSTATTLENAVDGADNYDHDVTPEIVSEHIRLIKVESARINKVLRLATEIGGVGAK